MIRQVAIDVVSMYERLGILSRMVATAEVPARFQRLATLLIRVDDGLRQQVREFAQALSAAVAGIPGMLELPVAQRPHVKLILTFDIDRTSQDAIASEIRYISASINED